MPAGQGWFGNGPDPPGFPWRPASIGFASPVPRQQQLLFPDPRPLEATLGRVFFRNAPTTPGVYLMHDAQGAVVYVGKARNLRQRLASYRLANPEQVPARRLRLLNAVARIEIVECEDEAAALQQEARLIRSLQPRFNRAGVWPAPARHFYWSSGTGPLQLGVGEVPPADRPWRGPYGGGVVEFMQALSRLLWCALHPEGGMVALPAGWIHGRVPAAVTLATRDTGTLSTAEISTRLATALDGEGVVLVDWIATFRPPAATPLDVTFWAEHLESLQRFLRKSAAHRQPTVTSASALPKAPGSPMDPMNLHRAVEVPAR